MLIKTEADFISCLSDLDGLHLRMADLNLYRFGEIELVCDGGTEISSVTGGAVFNELVLSGQGSFKLVGVCADVITILSGTTVSLSDCQVGRVENRGRLTIMGCTLGVLHACYASNTMSRASTIDNYDCDVSAVLTVYESRASASGLPIAGKVLMKDCTITGGTKLMEKISNIFAPVSIAPCIKLVNCNLRGCRQS